MANAYATNYSLFSSGETFSAIWKLSRAMLAAGWKYKASGNGQSAGTKDTSGSGASGNVAFDLWGVGGGVNLTSAGRGTGTGTGVSIGAAAVASGLSVITGVTSFIPASVGDFLVITGSTAVGGPGTSGTNNGNWRITAQTGSSVTVYAPGMVAETTNSSLTVTDSYSGVDGSLGTFSSTTSGQSTLINFTTSSFNGFTAADVGRYIWFPLTGTGGPASAGNQGAFLIASYVSSNNVLLYNPYGVATDAHNGTIQWVEINPLTQVYPEYLQGSGGQGAWLNLQGPTVMKVPIGFNAVTGTFIRGENVTQTTTGAQGEVLGVVQDTIGGTGYLVVAPRVVGTGGQAGSATAANMTYGWNASASTDTLTGALSGALVTTPGSGVAVPIAYISETVFWKDSATQGHIYHQKIDQNASTESATGALTGRFSTMSALSQVTSQVCPAGSTGTPTSNGFPTTGTYCVIGEGGAGSASTSPALWTVQTPTSPGRSQILCANALEYEEVSADGNWNYLQSCNSQGYQGLSYLRLDNQEDGDLDPYVHQGAWSGTLNGTPSRVTDATGAGTATDNMYVLVNTNPMGNSSDHAWKGFRRRGLSGETYSWFSTAVLCDIQNATSEGTQLLIENGGNPDQVACTPTITYVREPIWLTLTAFTAQNGGVRMRKGTPRWLFMCQGGSANATFDSLKWLVCSSTAAMCVAGPYDGVTTPSF